jgi:hypothetical protein
MNGRTDDTAPPAYVFDTNVIIAATAVVFEAQLITADEKLRSLVWPGFSAALPSLQIADSE